MEKLKVCPFCGGEAIHEKPMEGYPNNLVRCSVCRASTIWYADKNAAIAAWNHRSAPENKPLTLIDALRQTDEYIPLIFTQGGCWQFHKFLKSIYPEAEPYKVMTEPTIRIDRYDHIITKIGERYYDITGEVRPTDFIACSSVGNGDVPTFERWNFASNRLLARDCPHCGEAIAVDSTGNVDRPCRINKPLTLEQLREMDGEPVWFNWDNVGWGKVIIVDDYPRIAVIINQGFGYECALYTPTDINGKSYAYAQKPEQEENHD